MKKSGKIILGVAILVIIFAYLLYGSLEKKEMKSIEKSINKQEESNKEKESLNESSYSSEDIDNSSEGSESEKFKNTLVSIYENIEGIKGETVVISGFVYREVEFSEDRFVIGRILINSHGDHNHEQLAGILCEWKEASKFADKTWVRVTGTVDTDTDYDKNTDSENLFPLIKAIKVEEIDPPLDKNEHE